jgi:hypothetical protein
VQTLRQDAISLDSTLRPFGPPLQSITAAALESYVQNLEGWQLSPFPDWLGSNFHPFCVQESTLQDITGIKAKVRLGGFNGMGLAGDLSKRLGPPCRPEDDPDFYRT